MAETAIRTGLLVTSGVIGLELSFVAWLLIRAQAFKWLSFGFWAWVAFALYFVINPGMVALTNINMDRYLSRLSITEGEDRVYWILLVLVIGIAVFFWAYLSVKPSAKNRSDDKEINLSLPFIGVFIFWIFFGFRSLFLFRTFRVIERGDVGIVSARFTGDITGYEYSGYVFLFVPLALLMLSKNNRTRILGYFITLFIVVLALPWGWSRYLLVSFVLLVTMVFVFSRKQKWPPVSGLLIILILAAMLQQRGHTSVSLDEVPDITRRATISAIQDIESVLAAGDSAMLATFYMESYLYDSVYGYEYGLPVLNYLLTGWIPTRFFPEKYFLVDQLLEVQAVYSSRQIQLFRRGAKSSLVGDFYANGGLFGVILGMIIFGFMSKKADNWLRARHNPLFLAVLLSILSQLWMIWGSSMPWGLIRLGYILIPATTLWIAYSISLPANSRRLYQKSVRITAD